MLSERIWSPRPLTNHCEIAVAPTSPKVRSSDFACSASKSSIIPLPLSSFGLLLLSLNTPLDISSPSSHFLSPKPGLTLAFVGSALNSLHSRLFLWQDGRLSCCHVGRGFPSRPAHSYFIPSSSPRPLLPPLSRLSPTCPPSLLIFPPRSPTDAAFPIQER
ncbi:hypothetical protein FA13DRAFT_1455195 [Coprinellus micaceus]|uniref:Uncharacterized protein n=1 Tax=Coprinellus micaceus TaxID=71717 RepID=A0A4Y7SMM0_COPMI|nr:hypothetical protein FA13DRAFT_1455195 [Coprinellus micaceus]